jgi:glycosyltransferase involved in cell wall biosynthesis
MHGTGGNCGVKVLIVHELFAPDFGGGGEYVFLETARNLRLRGIDAQAICTGNPEVREYEGIPTTRLPVHRYRMNLAAAEVLEHARDADVILTATYHGCLPALRAARALGKPIVCLMLGLFGSVWKRMKPFPIGNAYAMWERHLVTRPYDRWVFISDYSREFGISMGIPAEKSVVNCPGIELEKYRPAPIKDDVVFVTGKLDARKGIVEILEVARQLPDVRFRIMGWGPRESKIRAAAPDNIEFVTFERDAPLHREFGKARIFLFPTKGETFGIALVEAMASGCAIVSSVPLPFEGVRIRPGDNAAMKEAIFRLWNDPEACEQFGRRNHDLAQQYSWPKYTDRLLQCFEDIRSERMNRALSLPA